MIEQAKFTYSPLAKDFEEQIKIIEDQARKRVEAWEVLKPEENQKYLKLIEEIIQKGWELLKLKIK